MKLKPPVMPGLVPLAMKQARAAGAKPVRMALKPRLRTRKLSTAGRSAFPKSALAFPVPSSEGKF